MASKKEFYSGRRDIESEILIGIYGVAKSIDQKVESLLEEIHDLLEARSEDYDKGYWEENGNGFI